MASFTNVSEVWSDDLLQSISVTEEQIDAAVCVRAIVHKNADDHVVDLEVGRRYDLWKDNPDLARRVNDHLAEVPKSRK